MFPQRDKVTSSTAISDTLLEAADILGVEKFARNEEGSLDLKDGVLLQAILILELAKRSR